MNIELILETARNCPVTKEQVEELRKRLQSEEIKPVTQEFLNRTYSL